MRIRLVTHYSDGSIQSDKTIEAADLTSALLWAVVNWSYAQGIRNPLGGYLLNDRLHVAVGDGPLLPLLDAVAADNMQAAA